MTRNLREPIENHDYAVEAHEGQKRKEGGAGKMHRQMQQSYYHVLGTQPREDIPYDHRDGNVFSKADQGDQRNCGIQ